MRSQTASSLNVDALFLGPKSENSIFFQKMMEYAVSEHLQWRADCHPEDPALLIPLQQNAPDFKQTMVRTEGILRQLSCKIKNKSVPFFSPRYLGHMTADTLMVSGLAYVMAMMYNQNNCAHEASPTTTELEVETGRDLCQLFGYDRNRSWGHITSGATVANYEAMWVARNLKSIPLAIAKHEKARQLVDGISERDLLNLSPSKVLDLIDKLKKYGLFEDVRSLSCRGVGIRQGSLGKILMPQSKHYSLMKAIDVLGIGQEHIELLPVDENYRTDIVRMREITFRLIEKGHPILAMVSVVGTTEEGAVDRVDEVIKLRAECEQKYNASFYVHVDAAYGGYARAMFLDENNQFIEYDTLIARYRSEDIIPEDVTWPKRQVYDGFRAMAEADSITVDPHKVGFIQYAAGAVCMKDKRILDLISYHAAYVFEDVSKADKSDNQVILGASIMEGSKAGATAAAVWAAHRLVPLNIIGYGQVIARGIVTADWLARRLAVAEPFTVGHRQFEVRPVIHPDFHMVNFTFREIGNKSLEDHNRLNKQMYELCSYSSGPAYTNSFLTSSTSLSVKEYGDSPWSYLASRGFSRAEWDRVQYVYILRAAVMTHCLRRNKDFEDYWKQLQRVFTNKLAQIVDTNNNADNRRK